MPKLTRIYTRTGDDGTTGLGSGERVPKDAPRIAAYGTVDELNSLLGVVLAGAVDASVAGVLRPIQNDLFHLGSELCFPDKPGQKAAVPRIEPRHVEQLEKHLDRFSAELGPLKNFILPGGSPGAAHLHLARTVCRRAERCVVLLARSETVGGDAVKYLNRLSDLLFVLARIENLRRGVGDVLWDSRA